MRPKQQNTEPIETSSFNIASSRTISGVFQQYVMWNWCTRWYFCHWKKNLQPKKEYEEAIILKSSMTNLQINLRQQYWSLLVVLLKQSLQKSKPERKDYIKYTEQIWLYQHHCFQIK